MDIDGDGYPDLLSGSAPGEIFLFRGTADHSFGAPEMLKDKNGAVINVGGGITEDANGILICGNAEIEHTNKGTFVTYRGKRMESTPQKPIRITGTRSAICVADWNGDGVLDLIVGDNNGNVYLIPNEGTPKAYAFGEPRALTTTNGKAVHVASRAGPCVADWDGDGDLDLLVGARDGRVWLYRNIGTQTAPKLALPVQLVGPGEDDQASKDVRPGSHSKICVVDWNGDGKPDLLVGDSVNVKVDLPEPTPEEKAKQDRVRKELEPLQKRYEELVSIPPLRVKEEHDKIKEEIRQLEKRLLPLWSQLPEEYETHGRVWLFLRR